MVNLTLAQVTSLPFFGNLVVKLVTYLKRIWDGFGSVLGQKGIKKPGKPINKGFPGFCNYSYSTVAGGLGV